MRSGDASAGAPWIRVVYLDMPPPLSRADGGGGGGGRACARSGVVVHCMAGKDRTGS